MLGHSTMRPASGGAGVFFFSAGGAFGLGLSDSTRCAISRLMSAMKSANSPPSSPDSPSFFDLFATNQDSLGAGALRRDSTSDATLRRVSNTPPPLMAVAEKYGTSRKLSVSSLSLIHISE